MGQTLENGVYLPSEGERNCYAGLKTNWEILDQKVADVTALQQAVAGALHREIVESLPTTDIDPNTIYMILSGTSATENVYNEYMYVNNAWELIGTSATDLTNYYTKAEVDGKLLLKASASDLTSHTGDTTIHVTTADKNKWNNQTYVFRYSSTALTASSTNANSLLDNTDNLKVGDKVIDSSGVLFSITAIDTQNSTFTIGTALIDLAQDSDVVHLSGNETKNGELTLSDTLKSSDIVPRANLNFNLGSPSYQWNNLYATNYYYNGTAWGLDQVNEWSENNKFNKKADLANITSVEDTTFAFTALNNTIFFNTRGSSNFKSYGTFLLAGYGNGSGQDRYGQIQLLRSTDKNGDTGNGYIPDSSFKMWRVAPHYLVMDFMENVRVTNDGTENSLKPITNNATDLGTSTNKWKSFNGVEPSSLSLPSGNASDVIDISSYLVNLDGTDNTYVAPSNGWITINMNNCSGIHATITGFWGDSRVRASAGAIKFLMPVLKNQTVTITIHGGTINNARFIPCQGNV